MTTNEKTIEKTFAEYITKIYNDKIVDNIKKEDHKDDVFEDTTKCQRHCTEPELAANPKGLALHGTTKIDEQPVNTSLLLVKTCQGCIDGQPNQEAHMNWGGCLSIYDESTEVEEQNYGVGYDDDTSSYCSTTSYESDGGNASSSVVVVEEVPSLKLHELTTSSILARRAANNN